MLSQDKDQPLKTGQPKDIEIATTLSLQPPTAHVTEDSYNPLLDCRQDEPVHSDMSGNSGPVVEDNKPDGGYGWFVVLGSFIMHMIVGGFERAEGIFFLQFQARFHQGAQLSAWPGAITSSIRLLSGPLATALGSQYSIRTCCMIGSVLQFVGLFLNSFAPNFFFLFLSHSLLLGLGRGLLYSPSLIILNMYFDKKLSRSAGLACSGVGIGSFFLVPLCQFLFDTYGFSGAFIVISAVVSNSLVVAMLFRPLSLYYKFLNSERKLDKKSQDIDLESGIHEPPLGRKAKRDSINSDTIKHRSANYHVYKCNNCIMNMSAICLPKEDSNYVKKDNKKIFHFHLLKDPPFLLFCVSIMLFTAAFKSAFTFFAALVKSKGYTDTEAAFVISVAGVSDTISRIVVGFVFDLGCLRPCRTVFYNVWIFALAAVSCMLPFLDSYIALCIVVSFYGALSGAYVSQKAIVSVDMLGSENMAASFGILLCFQGMGTMFGPPLSGAAKDIFGSFNEAFFFGGGLMSFAGIIMVFSNVFLAFKRRKSRTQNESEGTNKIIVNRRVSDDT